MLHALLVFAQIVSMKIIRVAKQLAINNTTVQKTPKLPGGALLKGRDGQKSRTTVSTETRQC